MKDALTGPATVERSEGEAIARARHGDAGAFEYLYKAHCRHVYSVCLRMIRNPAEAEDLTQQTFLQVFRKIGTFRGESGFSTSLHRVTVNIVLMRLRRRKRGARFVSCLPDTNVFSCCTTCLDTNTARSRSVWDARPVVQNRNFTKPANNCVDYCKKSGAWHARRMSPQLKTGSFELPSD